MPLGPQRSGKAGNIGENDIQASQMQVPGPEVGESGGKVLLPFRWTPNSIGVREACDEPGEDHWRHSDPVNAHRAENLAPVWAY